MSEHCPRVLLLAPANRREPLKLRLTSAPTPVVVTTASPAGAVEALAGSPPDAVVLAPAEAPTSDWASELARRCAPAPLVLVWPESAGATPSPPAEVAACIAGDARLGETVAAVLARAGGAGGAGGALKQILSRVPDPLLLAASDGHIIAANERFAELTGWSDAALLGHPLDAVLPKEVTARIAAVDGADWTAAAVALDARGASATVAVDVRASIVSRGARRATWLLRFAPRPAGRLASSPDAAAGALGALNRRIADAGGQLGGAHVRVIGLGRARQILGEQWAEAQKRVALVCEQTIEHALGPDDVAMATATGDFLVCFACDDDEEADRRAEALQATIDRRLFGEDGGELASTPRGREALEALSVEVEAAVLPPDVTAEPEQFAERFAAECTARRRERLAEFNRRLEDLRTSGKLQLAAMATPLGPLPSLVRASWFPPDHARLQALAEGAKRLDELRLALDLRRLALVGGAEKDGVFDDASAIVDIHVATVERRKSWDALLPVIQEIASSPRSWLVPNLVGVPADVHTGRLRDAVVSLKPFSRTQTVTLSARQLATLDLAALPCRLYVLTAAEAACALDTDLPKRIRARLEQAKVRLAVDGGSANLARAYGAALRTVHDDTVAPAA